MDKSSEYFNPEMETMTREQIEELQLKRLKATVRHCMNSAFYKKRFDDIGLSPDDIKSLDDLRKIPFTTKQDLRDTYPFGIRSVPLEKCVRLHSSSGTTGNPTVILHTQKDLDEWANAVARCLWMAPVLMMSSRTRPDMECLPAGWAFSMELRNLECSPFLRQPATLSGK